MKSFSEVMSITIIILMLGFSFYGLYQFWCKVLQKVREAILEKKRRAADKIYNEYLENK